VTLANGDLEVIFNNGNTAANNPNGPATRRPLRSAWQLAGGQRPPQLRGAGQGRQRRDRSGEPVCNFGRGPEECIPGHLLRTNDFPRIAVNRGNGHLYATWQDYRPVRRRPPEPVHRRGCDLDRGHRGGQPGPCKDHYEAAIDVAAAVRRRPATRCRRQRARHQEPKQRPLSWYGAGGAGDQRRGAGDHVAVSYYRTCQVATRPSRPAAPWAPASELRRLHARAAGRRPGGALRLQPVGGRGLRVPFGPARSRRSSSARRPLQTGFHGRLQRPDGGGRRRPSDLVRPAGLDPCGLPGRPGGHSRRGHSTSRPRASPTGSPTTSSSKQARFRKGEAGPRPS